jgi:hypothetical protein
MMRVMSRQGPESSTIVVDCRDEHHKIKARSVSEGAAALPVG